MAAASRASVGVDIERVRQLPAALTESAFSTCERRNIACGTRGTRSLTSAQRGALFWACKEALLKSWGRGLAFGMQRLCIEECEVGRGFSWRWAHQPQVFARPAPSRVDIAAGYALAVHWEHCERGLA
jgi:phosphopantetheinyl transferase